MIMTLPFDQTDDVMKLTTHHTEHLDDMSEHFDPVGCTSNHFNSDNHDAQDKGYHQVPAPPPSNENRNLYCGGPLPSQEAMRERLGMNPTCCCKRNAEDCVKPSFDADAIYFAPYNQIYGWFFGGYVTGHNLTDIIGGKPFLQQCDDDTGSEFTDGLGFEYYCDMTKEAFYRKEKVYVQELCCAEYDPFSIPPGGQHGQAEPGVPDDEKPLMKGCVHDHKIDDGKIRAKEWFDMDASDEDGVKRPECQTFTPEPERILWKL